MHKYVSWIRFAQDYAQRQDSSVTVVTRLRAGQLGFNSRQWQWRDLFSSPSCPGWIWGPPILLSN